VKVDVETYRLIAIDLDGTLLGSDGKLSKRTRSAVHRALSSGLRVCFATGRNWTESRSVIEAVGHHDWAVFVGGAMVVDTKSGATVHRTLVESKLAAELCAFIESRGHAALALQDTAVADADYLATADAPLNASTERWILATGAVMRRVDRLGGHEHPHTVRVGIVAQTDVAMTVLDQLVAEFGKRIVCHRVGVTPHGCDVLEIFGPTVNKWEGIRHIAEKYGIEQSQIIAVGDDVNDIPMIRSAGLGLAMGNAKPDVRAAADRVIGSNIDDGLAEFLEELVAGNGTYQKAMDGK
jgi:5-amino-6-(5-phospho-D-ribitylamino)uracil phosphatase